MGEKAVALKYDSSTSTSAPKVLASGKDAIAKKIIQKAEEFDIPLFANETLVNSLIDLDIDKEIPAELYQSVVEVFIWLMKNEKKVKER
jgi:flagellar biosynthesis protein